MHKLPDNGIVIGPYGGIGYFERHAPSFPAGKFSLRRLLRKLIATFNKPRSYSRNVSFS